jgi:hypothetical protein
MTTYVEQPDSGNVLGMVLLIIAVLAIVGFGIWFFSGYNSGPSTIIHDSRTETNTVTPIPTPTAPPINTPSGTDLGTGNTATPAPAGTGTGGTTP